MNLKIKFYLSLILFIYTFPETQAQSIYNEDEWGSFNSDCQATHNKYGFNSKRNLYRNEGIHQIVQLKHAFNADSVKQSTSVRSINYLDSSGNIVRSVSYEGDGDISSEELYRYNAKNQLIRVRSRHFYWRGKKWMDYVQKFSYFNDSLYASKTYSREKHNGRKGPEWRFTFKFTEDNLIAEVEYRKIHKDKSRLESRNEFEYYPNGQKKESRYYNKDNKLKRKFTYDCNINYTDIGQKNSTGICQLTDTLENGAIRRIKEFITGKGELYREILDWHPEEKWSVFKRYNKKNRLIYETKYQKLSANHSRFEMHYKGRKFFIPYSSSRLTESFKDQLGNFNQWEEIDTPLREGYVYYEYLYKRDSK